MYGKEIIIPPIIDVIICAENWPVMVLFWMINGKVSAQKFVSTPIIVAASHKNLYVGKVIFFGPKMIVSKIKSFIIKQINPKKTIAAMDLIICHLNSSRCSKKDMLLELVLT